MKRLRIALAIAVLGSVMLSACDSAPEIPDDPFIDACLTTLADTPLTQTEGIVIPGFEERVGLRVACHDLLGWYREGGCTFEAAQDHMRLIAENKIERITEARLYFFCQDYPDSAAELDAISTTIPNPWRVGQCVGEFLDSWHTFDCGDDSTREIVAIVSDESDCPASATEYLEMDDGSVVCLMLR